MLANGEKVDSKVVTAADGWKYEFNNLPMYKEGKEIVYTVTEEAVEDYTTTYAGYNIINKHIPETIEVSGTKTWDDAGNQDGKRPESITVNLLTDGEVVDSKVVTEADNWSYTFSDLPKYKDGVEIKYTVAEDSVSNYSTEIDGYNITNSYTPGKTSVTVTKNWDDANNQDGKRPESIQVQLLANGANKGEAITLNDKNNWTYTWTGLDEKTSGKDIKYSVKELTAIEGYSTNVNAENKGNIIITNSYTPETTQVSGTKTWDDADNQDGKRPASITVNLLADGEKVASKVVKASDNWKYTFDNLPKFKNGKAIVYTISEEKVDGYTTKVDGFNITNSYTPSQTTVKVTKQWDDNNDKYSKRPSSIKVQLYANGEKSGKAITLNTDNKWTYTWTGLAEYTNGKKITYTVKEVSNVPGYITSITSKDNAFTITNTFNPNDPIFEGIDFGNDSSFGDNDKDGLNPDGANNDSIVSGEEKPDSVVKQEDSGKKVQDSKLPQTNGETKNYAFVGIILVAASLWFLVRRRKQVN